jgi:GR25 family glycosyltransferase involved in LPS biosynthesis
VSFLKDSARGPTSCTYFLRLLHSCCSALNSSLDKRFPFLLGNTYVRSVRSISRHVSYLFVTCVGYYYVTCVCRVLLVHTNRHLNRGRRRRRKEPSTFANNFSPLHFYGNTDNTPLNLSLTVCIVDLSRLKTIYLLYYQPCLPTNEK